MNKMYKILFCLSMLYFISLVEVNQLYAQIIIDSNDFPSQVGTLIITKDDTVGSVIVNVGQPGENQIWRFEQDFPHVLTRQQIVAVESTPFHSNFPDADIAIQYVGKLGYLLHSYYFDNTYGTIFAYQKKDMNNYVMQGVGLDSVTLVWEEFSQNYTGSMIFEPNFLLSSFPLQYGDTLKTQASVPIEVQTTIFGLPVTLTAILKDTMVSVVDGWGTMILPDISYQCLCLKSHVTLNEPVYVNGSLFRHKHTRTITYHWIDKQYGIIAQIISHSNEPDDNFTLGKQVSRLLFFNPKINISIADTSGAAFDTLNVPILISNLTDLNISSIQTKINTDTSIIVPLSVNNIGTITEHWGNPVYELSGNELSINLNGETPLSGEGVLCNIKFLVNPNAVANDSTDITFTDISIAEKGPMIVSHPAKFVVNTPSGITNGDNKISQTVENFVLYPNYPNPFNPDTNIKYQISAPANINIRIYNSAGQLINILVDEYQEIGIHNMLWNGQDFEHKNVPSGIYFYHFRVTSENTAARTYEFSRKMILLR